MITGTATSPQQHLLATPLGLLVAGADVALPFVALACWVLVIALAVTPLRHRRRRPRSDDGWHPPAIGPPESDGAIAQAPPGWRAARLPGLRRVAPEQLPTLSEVVGHAATAIQLDDLLGPVLDAGLRPYRRPWTAVLVHGGTAADAELLVGAVAGEHEAPLLHLRGSALARSTTASAAETVLEHARASAPCVLVLWDLETLVARRDIALQRATNDLLTQLRRLDPSERVAVVGIVDDPHCVPQRLRGTGGFDREVAVEPLTSRERARLIRREALLHGVVLGNELRTVVGLTDGLTMTQLRAVVATAARSAGVAAGVHTWSTRLTARDVRSALETLDKPAVTLRAFGEGFARVLRDLVRQLAVDEGEPVVALVGAAGNGTTTAARWLAERSNRHVMWLDGRDLLDLTPADLSAIVDRAAAQAPSLVVIDDIDEVLGDQLSARTHLAMAIEHLLATQGITLVVTARDTWTPRAAGLPEDLITVHRLRAPNHAARATLIRLVAGGFPPSAVTALADQLHGATREQVIEAATATYQEAA